MSNAVSSIVAGAGLLLLTDHSRAALGTTAFHRCNSQKEWLSVLPSSENYYLIYEVKDCLLACVGLTVSSFTLNVLSCETSASLLCIISAFSAVSSSIGLNVCGRIEKKMMIAKRLREQTE